MASHKVWSLQIKLAQKSSNLVAMLPLKGQSRHDMMNERITMHEHITMHEYKPVELKCYAALKG